VLVVFINTREPKPEMVLILFFQLLHQQAVVVEAHHLAEIPHRVVPVVEAKAITTETQLHPVVAELLVKVILVALVVQVTDSVLVLAVVVAAELVQSVVTLAHKVSDPVVVAV